MKLAIFDFDGTLFPEQTIPFLMKYYIGGNYPKMPYLKYQGRVLGKMIRYQNPFNKKYGKEEFRREVALEFVQIFNGMDQAKLHQFLSDVVEAVVKCLSSDVVEEVVACKANGYHCVLLSGCYTPLLTGVAEAIGIDTVIGTNIDQTHIRDGKVCIKALDIATGERKVQKLLEIMNSKDINWQESVAYGDSSYDRNILELVGEPVAVRPDEGLRALAESEDWRVIE
ncbi:MAG: HAD family hydrolase [Cellulosilyticaceae bacterium]